MKRILIIVVAFAIMICVPELIASSAQNPTPFDANSFYRLTTLWQGECKSLDIFNDRYYKNDPILAQTGDYSGQYWKIAPLGDGYYRLTTLWQRDGKSLDIINDGINNNRPILAPTGNYSGQFWKIAPLGDDYYRLTTLWQGDGKSLDIINDGFYNNRPILAPTGYYSGQYWKITEAKFVTVPPANLNLDPFYKKYLDAEGIPVISSEKVPDAALYKVRFMALHMLSRIPDVLNQMVAHNARIAVMAISEVTTDIPEHAFLANDPEVDWNQRARGVGGTVAVPTSSCAEENVLCYTTDPYKEEDIFIHEFAHTIHNLGLEFAYPRFQDDLDTAYINARNHGLWTNTYAITNKEEYFAEGVQCWFNVNAEANPPDGIHNHVDTRNELRVYDPMLYHLLERYFPFDENKCSCH